MISGIRQRDAGRQHLPGIIAIIAAQFLGCSLDDQTRGSHQDHSQRDFAPYQHVAPPTAPEVARPASLPQRALRIAG